MSEEERIAEQAPPAGEEIHLPGPTYLPVFMAAGIALGLIGITINLVFTIAGALIFLWTLVRWVRQTRADMDELPLDHGGH